MLFSAISPICESFCIDRSGCRHQRPRSENRSKHRVDTVASIGHTAVRTLLRSRTSTGIVFAESGNYSQKLFLIFLLLLKVTHVDDSARCTY